MADYNIIQNTIKFNVNTSEVIDGFITKRTKSTLVNRDKHYDIATKQLAINNNIDLSFINAIDIDWNNAYLPNLDTYINTTGELLFQIDSIYNQLQNIDIDTSDLVTIEAFNTALSSKANLSDIPQYISDLIGYDSYATIPWVNEQLYSYAKSPYDVYVEVQRDKGLPYVGKEAWLESLNGKDGTDGKSAWQIALYYNQTTLDELSWVQSLQGKNGLSAFELAQQEDPTLTSLTEWLQSLKGERGNDGENGKSAFELAQEDGFIGTKEEWYASLKGDKGDKGDPGASINILGYYDTLDELKEATIDTINSLGDAYNVGGKFYVYNDEYTSIDDKWKPAGTLQGPEGKSAYQIYKELQISLGNEPLLEPQWLESLKGEQGSQGATGASAYDIYKDLQIALGNEPLEPLDWINSLSQAHTYTAGNGIQISADNVISIIEKTANDYWLLINS